MFDFAIGVDVDVDIAVDADVGGAIHTDADMCIEIEI